MRLVRFEHEGQAQPGLLVDDAVISAARHATTMPELIERFDEVRGVLPDGPRVPLAEVRLLAPLPRPRTILCAIGNFFEHAERDPLPLRMFLKNPDAVVAPGGTVVLPDTTDPWMFMHEAELGIVLAGPGRIFGYTGVIDVSARGEGRTSWGAYSWLGKSFDTFCPIGPCIVTCDEIPQPNALRIRLWNDGQLRHDYSTDDMEHPVPELVAWASARVPLVAGDLIACGTNHEGLGPLQHGEHVVLEIEGVGQLHIDVEDPLRRSWDRGVYMGRDSTNHEALARHGVAVRPRT